MATAILRDGMSQREAAAAVGVSAPTVSRDVRSPIFRNLLAEFAEAEHRKLGKLYTMALDSLEEDFKLRDRRGYARQDLVKLLEVTQSSQKGDAPAQQGGNTFNLHDLVISLTQVNQNGGGE